jgi:SAM-dependent methyltransferase
MKDIVHYSNCPSCLSARIEEWKRVKDHSVTGESFPVMQCRDCSLRFTQDIPSATAISPYYKSENYISHTNTSKGIVNRIYQAVRKRTLAGKRRLVTKYSGATAGTLLDIGSGVGSFVHEMKSHQWQVTGLEPDPDARKIASETYNLVLTDTGEFNNQPDEGFDAITMWHVLEHVHDLHPYLQHIKKILKPGGRFFIAVPNYTAFDSRAYKEYWAAYDVPRHLYHFSPPSMKRLIESNGMEIVTHKPMWYDSFYISILSSKYKNGKTKWPSAIWNGLRSNFQAIGDATKCSSVIYIVRKKG